MPIQHGDIEVIEKSLTDYKLKAQTMNVGVNYMALDEERRRQEHLLRELRDIEEEISSPSLSNTKLPHLASIVGTELKHNTKCLQYLTGISELERSIGEVAAHFAERSVELSNPNSLHKDVITYKTLTDNVKSCWNYVDQLSTLAQIHLRASAEYHQFFHEANEIEAKLAKQLTIAQKMQQSAAARRSHKEATKVSNEIREQLDMMRSLWKRSMDLVKRSESIVPIRLRLGGVARGSAIGDPNNRPVMVRAMVGLTGPDYRIQKGEHLRLIDNRQETHLWRVQTSSGVVEVPSICFWLTDCDTEATERAISIKQQCKKTWLDIINLIRLRLYSVYTDLLDQFNSREVYCFDEDALRAFFRELQQYLISTVGQDGRLKDALEIFQKRVVISKRLERLQSEDINLRESDIMRIRAPLLRLQDHLVAADQMQEDMKRINDRITEYLSEVDNDRRRIAKTLDHLTQMTKRSEHQLKAMVDDMNQWKFASENGLDAHSSRRIKVEPLRFPEQDRPRSRSQPRMSAIQSTSDSTASDSETINMRARNRAGRGKGYTLRLDAVVQLNNRSKSVETQNQDGYYGVSGRHPTSHRHKSIQLGPMATQKRTVMTQIGFSYTDGGVQADPQTLDLYNIEVNGTKPLARTRSLASSSDDDDGHEYIPELPAAIPLQAAPKSRARRKYTSTTQAGQLSKKKSASMSNLVNSCTQLGTLKYNKATSPIPGLEPPECQYCRPRNLLTSQTQIGPLYSLSERYQYAPHLDVASEQDASKNRICKRVQCGYPCLTDRVNLACQCDVLGPTTGDVQVAIGPKLVNQLYQTPMKPPRQKRMNSYAQIGTLYSNSQQQVGEAERYLSSASTQIGYVNAEPVSSSIAGEPVPPGRSRVVAQYESRSMHDLSSSSAMIDSRPLPNDQYIAGVSMRPRAENSATQIGTIVSKTSVQTDSHTDDSVVSKRIQTGYPQLYGKSESYTQIGSLYRQADINVEPAIAPIVATQPPLQSAPPAAGIRYDDATQVSQILAHDEVQTRDLPEFHTRRQSMQVQSKYKRKPKRSSSMPSFYQSTETQVGPMVTHESLSPLADDYEPEPIRPTEVVRVRSMPKTTRNKRVQSQCLPTIRNVEMQVGQLFQTNEVQTDRAVDRFEDQAIVPTLLSVQQKAVSMPDVGLAETQACPVVHGKKVQVAIAMDEHIHDKTRNKKLQVSLASLRDMYDVEVETLPILQKEHFDVSCDTMILPDNISKKIQVSLLEEKPPAIQMVENQAPLYAAMPTRSVMEPAASAYSPETHGKKMQVDVPAVFSAPPSVVDTGCDAIYAKDYFDAQCQCEPLKPATFGKKLQVEIATNSVPRQTTDVACDPIEPVKTLGKKMQVEMGMQAAPLEKVVIQTVSKEVQDKSCAFVNDTPMFDAHQQTGELAEPEPILVENAPAPVFAAPPEPQKPDVRDIACEALKTDPTYEGFTQSEKVPTFGKKLQVAVELQQPVPTSYVVAASQAICQEPLISLQQPRTALQVFSAPPQEAEKGSVDTACEALENAALYDASVQAAELGVNKPAVVGKKLQVSPPLLTTTTVQTENVLDTKLMLTYVGVQTADMPAPVPQVVHLEEAPKVFSAPPPQPQIPTEDRACEAIVSTAAFDAGVQVAEMQQTKPVTFGKKLQVAPSPYAVSVTQTTADIPAPQTVRVEEAPKVFAAPPPQPQIPTEDRACDAIVSTAAFDAGIQAAEMQPAKPVSLGKKLQVTPSPYAVSVTQTTAEYSASKMAPVLAPVLTTTTVQTELVQERKLQMTYVGIQTADILPQPAPQVVRVEEAPKVFAAPPPQPQIPTEDRACEAIVSTAAFDAGTQAAEMQPSKPVSLGKKLQVTPSPYAVSVAQTTAEYSAPKMASVLAPVLTTTTVQTELIQERMLQMTYVGIQTADILPQPAPQVVRVEEAPKVFAAPPPQPQIPT
uniref:SH3_10 domain-containing protein n=1 Tax=Mesocestoides corti TaxID=53468 RepID=A0A5K3FSG5_MESCO